MFGLYDNGIMQTYFSVIVKNSNEDKKEEFKKVVFDTLNNKFLDEDQNVLNTFGIEIGLLFFRFSFMRILD